MCRRHCARRCRSRCGETSARAGRCWPAATYPHARAARRVRHSPRDLQAARHHHRTPAASSGGNGSAPALFVLLLERRLAPASIVEVGSVFQTRMRSHVRVELWRSVRGLPDFWRLLQLRMASQFGDGLFQAGMAGALLFNPDRAADPMAIARAFAVLFLPYSLLGPFAGALMDRWDRRLVLVGA